MGKAGIRFHPTAAVFGVEIQVKYLVVADGFKRNVLVHAVRFDISLVKQPFRETEHQA